MVNIKELLSNLRFEINEYRHQRGDEYILADVLSVEIAISLVEFCIKKNRTIKENEEIWFEASYALAYSLEGTDWEKIYLYYKDLVTYVKASDYFRKDIPKNVW